MNRELELYLHIPFCVRKCDYCDFLSFAGTGEEKAAYVRALVTEIEAYREFGTDYQVDTVFLGGGTPSLLEAEQTREIMDALHRNFSIENTAEITTEANPGTVTEEKLRAYRESGINRLSLGLQSTHNEELECLGRIHTYQEFLLGYRLAREAGFSNINVDLMSGIPSQREADWEENLHRIGALAPEHISAYSLIVEQGTPFYQRELQLPGEEEERRMYENTARILQDYGYCQYEISNYAKPGFACRHNVGYWKRKNYLGLGLGASSMVHEVRFSNTDRMGEYRTLCGNPPKMRKNVEFLDEKARMEEFMFLGLRMSEGVSKGEFIQKFQKDIGEVYREPLEKFKQLGLLHEDQGKIFLTREGISVSNLVMAEFLL